MDDKQLSVASHCIDAHAHEENITSQVDQQTEFSSSLFVVIIVVFFVVALTALPFKLILGNSAFLMVAVVVGLPLLIGLVLAVTFFRMRTKRSGKSE